LDIYKNVADMSPFYDAFGVQRFKKSGGQPEQAQQVQSSPKVLQFDQNGDLISGQ
jgi:hypothetical protein